MTNEPSGTPPLGARFWGMWAGRSASLLGGWIQMYALPLWVLHVTGSAVASGFSFVVEVLPKVVLSPWAGVVADRFDRRRVIIATDALAAIVVALMICCVHARQLAGIYLLIAVLQVLATVANPVGSALVPAVAPADRLTAGNALLQASVGFSMVVGPLLGVAISTSLGIGWALAVNMASFLLGVLSSVLALPAMPMSGAARGKPLRALRRGVDAILLDRVLRGAIGTEAVIFLFFGGVPNLTAVLLGQERHGGTLVGLFVGGHGLGFLLLSALLGRARRQIAAAELLLVGAALSAPTALVVVTLVGRSPALTVLAGCATGVHNLMFVLGPTTVCQRRADNAVLGRVFACRRTLVVTGQLVCVGVGTVVGAAVGLRATILTCGLLASATAVPFAVAMRRGLPNTARLAARPRGIH